MRFRLKLAVALFFAILATNGSLSQVGILPAQGADAESATAPRFDVISVKPNKTADTMSRARLDADGLAAENVTVHMLLLESYQLNDDQLLGEPAWAKTDRFDIHAKVAGPDVAKLAKLDQGSPFHVPASPGRTVSTNDPRRNQATTCLCGHSC